VTRRRVTDGDAHQAPRRYKMGTSTALRMHDVEPTCLSGKICYETYLQAQVQAERAMQRGEVWPGCHVHAYRCDRCARFHIGNVAITFGPEDKTIPIACACGEPDREVCKARNFQ
jgi:hypothetical protein